MSGAGGGVWLVALAATATVVVACAGRSDVPTANSEAGASLDASTGDAEEALGPGVAYVKDGIKCCANGLDCCGPDEWCGRSKECTGVGVGIAAKVPCSRCCAGLVPISRATVVDGRCVFGTALDSNFCAACGDGVCRSDAGENKCNCPADCR